MSLSLIRSGGTIDLNKKVTSENILDSSITNDDIATSAAIAKSKLSSSGTFTWAEISKSGSVISETIGRFFGTIATITTALTNYFGLNLVGLTATEILAQTMIDQTGTISGFSVKAATNTLNVSALFTLRKNGVDTGITATITAGVTTLVDSTGSAVAVVAGDLISVSVVVGVGTGTILNLNGFLKQTIVPTLA